jgi:ferrous iron transport protein B
MLPEPALTLCDGSREVRSAQSGVCSMAAVPLGNMKPGQAGRVAGVGGDAPIRRRLREMGVVAGKDVRVVRVAPLGDPIDVVLMGYHLSMRRSEAAHVMVDVGPSGAGDVGPRGAEETASSAAGAGVALADAAVGHDYQVVEMDGGRGLREHLKGIGVSEGSRVTLVGKGTDGPVTLRVGESEIAVGSRMARRLRVAEIGSDERPIRVALAGNPNSGKTTVFNNLTGTRQKVGNYPGVTVEKKVGAAVYDGRTLEITDLPGNYSLTPYTPEERVARRLLLEGGADVVVDVVDASNLERNLYLATQLMELGLPLVLAFNMSDLAKAHGQQIDHARLSGLLGVPIVPMVGNRNRGTRELLETIVKVAEGEIESRPKLVRYGRDIDAELDKIERTLDERLEPAGGAPHRWLALKLLEGDDEVRRTLRTRPGADGGLDELVAASARHLHALYGDEPEALIADGRYGFISGACQEAVVTSPERRHDVSDQIDTVVTNRWLGLPIFALLMLAMFALVFGLGNLGIAYVERGVEWLGGQLEAVLPDGLIQSLLVDGIVAGVGNVIVFLPLVVLLFLAIAFLEDTGYMARAAFVIDRVMHLIGLHGRSFIPMLLGFGCSVPAVMATRTLASRRDRLTTMLVVPLMSCGARLPIYALLAGAFFAERAQAWVVFSLYMLGVLLAGILAKVFRKTVFPGPSVPFVMELPPYRMPMLRGVLTHMWRRAWLYLKRAATVILLFSIVMWFLQTFPRERSLPGAADAVSAARAAGAPPEEIRALERQQAAEHGKRSYAGRIGTAMAPLLRPIGLGDWKVATALVSGFFAKEAVVSTLGEAYAAGDAEGGEAPLRKQIQADPFYTPLRAYTLMVFTLLYVPCMVTVVMIGRESGSIKWALFAVGYSTALAYVVSLLVYQGGRLLGLG